MMLYVWRVRGVCVACSCVCGCVRPRYSLKYPDVCRYGMSTKSCGVITIVKDIKHDPTDRHIIIVEDLVDTGTHRACRLCDGVAPRG